MNDNTLHSLHEDALQLLKQLISIPSFSREEDHTAQAIFDFLSSKGVDPKRHLNNVWAQNIHFDASKPTVLLNSHHDTVKPNAGYTRDPFTPVIEEGKLFGLGSNDAGGPLVALSAVFLYFHDKDDLPFNVVYAATAEEEISGKNGIESLLPLLPSIDVAIVGEPTLMNMAIAERGLLVVDCKTFGKSGHAAREEGMNAIYAALPIIQWFKNYQFEKISPLLGPVKMTVTALHTNNQAHNVVPDECSFLVDIRINEMYTHEEVLEIIRFHANCEVKERSTRIKSSIIPIEHPLVQAGMKMGRTYYGSPTTSDKALMPFPALKMGPGDSARSHTADEFIFVDEIREAISLYIALLENLQFSKQ